MSLQLYIIIGLVWALFSFLNFKSRRNYPTDTAFLLSIVNGAIWPLSIPLTAILSALFR